MAVNSFPSDDKSECHAHYPLLHAHVDCDLFKKVLQLAPENKGEDMIDVCCTHVALDTNHSAVGLGAVKVQVYVHCI